MFSSSNNLHLLFIFFIPTTLIKKKKKKNIFLSWFEEMVVNELTANSSARYWMIGTLHLCI